MRGSMCFLLSVVIPIADSGSSWRSEIEDDAHGDTRGNKSNDAPSEGSECTEEEKVAVEQLTELRRMRGLSFSQQHDTEEYGSYSTDTSFSTYDRKRPLVLAAPPSMTCDSPSTSSPATSSSHIAPARRGKIWDLKHVQEQQKPNLKQDHVRDACDQNDTQVSAISKHANTLLGCDHLELSDDGKRLKPRSRLLSDIYGDHSKMLSQSSFVRPMKTSKRRKAISKIMMNGQPLALEALAAGKDLSADASA